MVKVTPTLKKHLIKEGFDPVYGARPLKRAIQKLVLNPLAARLLEIPPSEARRERAFKVDFSKDKVGVTSLGS